MSVKKRKSHEAKSSACFVSVARAVHTARHLRIFLGFARVFTRPGVFMNEQRVNPPQTGLSGTGLGPNSHIWGFSPPLTPICFSPVRFWGNAARYAAYMCSLLIARARGGKLVCQTLRDRPGRARGTEALLSPRLSRCLQRCTNKAGTAEAGKYKLMKYGWVSISSSFRQ